MFSTKEGILFTPPFTRYDSELLQKNVANCCLKAINLRLLARMHILEENCPPSTLPMLSRTVSIFYSQPSQTPFFHRLTFNSCASFPLRGVLRRCLRDVPGGGEQEEVMCFMRKVSPGWFPPGTQALSSQKPFEWGQKGTAAEGRWVGLYGTCFDERENDGREWESKGNTDDLQLHFSVLGW